MEHHAEPFRSGIRPFVMEHGYNTDPEDSTTDWDVHFTGITKTFLSPNLANRDTVVTSEILWNRKAQATFLEQNVLS